MSYQVLSSTQADKHVKYLQQFNRVAFEKFLKLVADVSEHPRSGIGKPEPLKYQLAGCWSRRITAEHRMVYEIDDINQIVTITSAKGHY